MQHSEVCPSQLVVIHWSH